MQPHRILKEAAELLGRLILAKLQGAMRRDRIPPPWRNDRVPTPRRIDREARARAQLAHTLEQRLVGVVADAGCKEVPHPGKVHAAGEARQADELLDLGGEGDAVPVRGDVERLDAETVARREEALVAAVPDEESPHPAQALEAGLAPFCVGREQHLAVGVGGEGAALAAQLVAQLEIIVDLPVENEVEAPARIGHRLKAGVGEIEDRKPPVPERDRARGRGEFAPARPVRPAMGDEVDARALGREGDGAVKTAHMGEGRRRLVAGAPAPVETTGCLRLALSVFTPAAP